MSNIVSLSAYKATKQNHMKKQISNSTNAVNSSEPIHFSDQEIQDMLHEDEVRLMNGLEPKYDFRSLIRAQIQNAINESDYSSKH